MSDAVQGSNGTETAMSVDTPMESPEKLGKGKGKMAEEMPAASDEEESEEEGDGEVEEPDEDNMEEIDTDNIVNSRTRGKNIDYAEAAKKMEAEQGDEDDDDDEDFEEEDDKMQD
ncbi:Histone H2A.Z-specific chaperone CHZ1 [Elasticomyces elasticus]|nr:Histone H2A.Z-specific chaperone CHZ1 [Elasticomyces elasticus]KAK3645918.1 Histone H2A.Z-specific chaperone CHZ1 [Elasticomyces elasticus]KAK4928131.1 Histone H2A.Z-specific chaperone CHZ1 [Elasticomyces elasticus]KAK5765883.1 Histone H2A.Z-specific chaperone CHZ1 [Elasticomyces elasticus]